MKTDHIAKANVTVNAPAAKVWDALTNPAIIKEYFFGTEAISDWKVGSSLQFKGEYQGKSYQDKGTILRMEPNKIFQHTYYSSMSNREDKPENYNTVTYELSEADGKTNLSLTQDNNTTEESKQHSEQNWKQVLDSLKKVVEKE